MPPREAEIARLLQFAYQSHGAGQQAPAEKAFRQALTLDPNHVEALRGLSFVLFQAGRPQEAVEPLSRLARADRRNPDSHFTYALALRTVNRLDEAADHYAKAIKLKPSFPEALYELGNVLAAQQKLNQAAEQYKRAIAINPRFAEAMTNLGNVLMSQGRTDEAISQWQHALAANPNYHVALMNIGVAQMERGKVDEAIAQYRKVLMLAPNAIDAHYNLGNALRECGEMKNAIAHYDRALSLNPNYADARFARCMAQLPILNRSERDIAERRAAYEQSLRALADEVRRLPSAAGLAAGIGSNPPFYLAYQGLNDRALQTIYGELICRIMADKHPPAAMPPPPKPSEKIRVGIVSGHFRLHSVRKIPLQGWITQLDRTRFEVYGYHTGGGGDAITQQAASLCERFIKGPMPADRWRDAEQHYSEKLVRLPNISVHYEPLDAPSVSMARSDLGLRPQSVAFWSGQSLFKYLPQYDAVFPRIAKEVPDCQFVFIEYPRGQHVTGQFRERLDGVFSEYGLKAADHCVILPRLNPDRFIAAVGPCDIVLDSIGWSGFNSTLEGLTHSLPIVTMKGPLMRGRHSAAVLTMMGVTDTITETVDDYIKITVRLANDASFRADVKRRIAENKHHIYRDRSCIAALEDFLDHAAGGSTPQAH